MTCKKSGCYDNGGSCCKKNQNVCYYKCANKQDSYHKCECIINKTEELIDQIEEKNEKLGKNLEDGINAVKGISDIMPDITDLEKALNDIQTALDAAVPALQAIKDAVDAIEDPNGGLDDLEKAQEKQEKIACLVDELECKFEATVECLSKTSCSNPILVPVDDCEEDWDCGCHRPCKHKDC
ncbi:hypothetical protein J0L31_02250 [Terrisporobacter glycolicus]|nr:hypothetical protein [Terrisporobacter glycolicus]